MDDRQFAEACVTADEMLPAVDTALQLLEVSPAEREVIEGLVKKVERAKEARSLQKLKSALNELDKETEPLAVRLIEKL